MEENTCSCTCEGCVERERPCSQSTETRPGSNQRHQTDPSPAQGDRSTVIDLPVASENLSQPNGELVM